MTSTPFGILRRCALAGAAVLAMVAVVQPAPALAASPGTAPVKGVPFTGPRGVVVNVADLAGHPAVTRARGSAPVRQGPARRSPAADRRASSAAPGARAATGSAPLVSVATSFLGGTLSEAQSIPPDSMGAAGPTQFVVVVNGLVRSFDKSTGVADNVLNVSTDTLFAPVLATNLSTSDPRVRYDRLSGRWFISMITQDVSVGLQPANRVLLAVSSGSTITPTSTITEFAFQQDAVTPVGNDAGCFLDFDTLGIDVSALYVGGDFFCSNGSQQPLRDAGLFVIRKSSVLGSGPMVVTAFRNLTNGLSAGPFAPQGADNDDPNASIGYVIGVDVALFSHLQLREVTNAGGTPSISGNIDIPVPATAFNLPGVPHMGSDGRNLDGIDDRLTNAVIRNGTLWTAHGIEVDGTGVGSQTGGRLGARWYQIVNLVGTTPLVGQFATVFDGSATNPNSFWLPSINVTAKGDMALGGSIAGAAHFADAWTAGHLATDPAGTTGAPIAYTATTAAYNPVFQFADDPHRWGDFSFTSVDPDDGMTMWTIQEYANAPNSWGVRVAKLLAPPPVTPLGATPSVVPRGIASVNVAITGSTQSGAGFFDPGSGFAKRIAASVGGGVVVNSVRFDGPSRVVLNLDTRNATVGPVGVTVTNPDGQSASASGVLSIGPATGQLRATTNPALPSQISVDGTPADSWGLNWLDLPAGSHTVAYAHVEGFTEPAQQSVTITAGATTTLAGSFTQRGSLRVLTNPAVAAPISVDGTPRDDFGMWTDIPTGSHQVCFGPAAGFTPPPCQTVAVTAGTLTQITGNYTSAPGAPGPSGTGLLRVTTSPALPSQVLVDGVPMDSWGLNWVDLAPGTHTLAFTHVEGFTEPAPRTVTVTAGATTTVTGTFTQRGSLRVITSPAVPAQITVDGIPRDNFGMWTDIPTGSHVVCFGWAPQSVAPACQPATVTAGTLTTLTGTYTPGP